MESPRNGLWSGVLTSLKVNQFRCFDSLRLSLEPGVTIFVGDNAQGKTSILEAACVLLRLQSPRSSNLADAIQIDDPASVTISNSIIWNGTRAIVWDDDVQIDLTHCNLSQSIQGEGNLVGPEIPPPLGW